MPIKKKKAASEPTAEELFYATDYTPSAKKREPAPEPTAQPRPSDECISLVTDQTVHM